MELRQFAYVDGKKVRVTRNNWDDIPMNDRFIQVSGCGRVTPYDVADLIAFFGSCR